MTKRKMFLYGLGAGLVAGALLMQLGSIGQSAGKATESPPTLAELTAGQLRAIAEEHGYALYDADEPLLTAEEADRQAEEAAAQAREEALAEGGSTVYALTIGPGSTLSTVAELVYSAGFVENPSVFTDAMTERGLQYSMRAGYYSFTGAPQLDELIERLTSPAKPNS